MSSILKKDYIPNSITVTELKNILKSIEDDGNGDLILFCGYPTSLGFGVTSPKGIEEVIIDNLFGKPIAYIKIK